MKFRIKILLVASAFALTGAQSPDAAVAPADDFPCDTLTENMTEIYSGFGEPLRSDAGAVALQQGALLAAVETPVLFRKYLIADPKLQQKKPVIFRRYLIDGVEQFCTVTPDNRIFGKRDTRKRFRLRCLIDADGDGQYEAAMPVGKYVKYNPVTGLIVTRPQPPATQVALPEPVTLLEAPDAPLRKPDDMSYIHTWISVGEVGSDTAEIILNSAVDVTPDEPDYALVGDRRIVLARIFDGNEFDAAGAKLRIDKTEKGWAVRVIEYRGPDAQLQCSGKVIVLPKSYTVVTAEQQRVVLR